MGDRTNAALTIYACPPEQVGAVLKIRDAYLRKNDWGDHESFSPQVLQLGGMFGAHEVSCGSSDEIHSRLLTEAPGATWFVTEDPYAEWLGSLNVHIPDVGSYGAECDANGSPVFDRHQVRTMLNMDPQEARRALGDPWLCGALDDLLPTNKEHRLLPALDTCPECGEWSEQGRASACGTCVEILDEHQAYAQHRLVCGHIPDSDRLYAVARPSSITFQCRTCAGPVRDGLRGRQVEVTTTGYWPTESQVHAAHHGFGIGIGGHRLEDMEIKEVTV